MKKWISLLAVAALSTTAFADVQFDDFENSLDYAGDGSTNGDNQTDLGATFNEWTEDGEYYQGGYWYAYNDTDNGGNSSASPDYMKDKEFTGGLTEGGAGGSSTCLSISIQLGDATDKDNTAFYGIGASFKEETDYFDFSNLTAVTFDAKGSGWMVIKLLTKVTSAYTWGDMCSPFELESDWKSYSVSASDFAPEKWSDPYKEGIKWDDTKGAVNKLHFQTYGEEMKAGDKVDFSVDNIVLKGMDLSDFGSPVSVSDAKVVASDVELGDAYPNPFNPVTTINFALPSAEKVSLKVFDAAGNLVKTLYNGVSAGNTVQWNATNVNGAKVASGVYFYRLTSGSKVITKKMVLLK